HEVDVRLVAQAFELAHALPDAERVPAHVRDLDAFRAEPDDLTRQHAQPRDGPELARLLEQDLHADTDAQEGPPRAGRAHDGVAQAGGIEVRHAGAERADAGKDDRVRALDVGGGGRHANLDVAPGVRRRALEALGGAPQVPDAVVDDRDHRAPFVDSTPVTRGSSDVA